MGKVVLSVIARESRACLCNLLIILLCFLLHESSISIGYLTWKAEYLLLECLLVVVCRRVQAKVLGASHLLIGVGRHEVPIAGRVIDHKVECIGNTILAADVCDLD